VLQQSSCALCEVCHCRPTVRRSAYGCGVIRASERPTPVLAPELHPPLTVSYVSPGPASRDAPSPTLALPRDVSSPTLSPPPAVWRREDSPDTLARLPGSESKAAASAQPSSRRRGCGHLRPRLVGSDRVRPVSAQMQPTLPPQPSAFLRALPVARCQSPSPRIDPQADISR
jgi:hypothetical protein